MRMGVLIARHLSASSHLAQQGAGAVGGIVRGAATGTTKLLEGADEAGIAYKAARNLGADRRYSAAYAAPVVRAAGLARAMGMHLPEPIDRAIQTRAAAAREPLSGRAMAAVGRDVKALKPKPPKGGAS